MAQQKDNQSNLNETDYLQRENLNPDDFEETELANDTTKKNKDSLNNNKTS